MTTTPSSGEQGQQLPPSSILDDSFDDFLARAEHELICRQREVRTLRRRARRQRRRVFSLRTRMARYIGKAGPVGLAAAGTTAFGAGTVLLVSGDADAAKDAFALSAAAWGAANAARTVSRGR
ncbi:hypothetical protein ACWGNN_31500 [Streptomyces sp. NPDC055817]